MSGLEWAAQPEFQKELSAISSEIEGIFRELPIIKGGKIDFDRVWSTRRGFEIIDPLVRLFDLIEKNRKFDKLACLDSPGSIVGLLPLTGILAQRLEKPLVVVKDTASLLHTEPTVIAEEMGGSVLVVYGITQCGNDAVSTINALSQSGFDVAAFITLIDLEHGGEPTVRKALTDTGGTAFVHTIARASQLAA